MRYLLVNIEQRSSYIPLELCAAFTLIFLIYRCYCSYIKCNIGFVEGT